VLPAPKSANESRAPATNCLSIFILHAKILIFFNLAKKILPNSSFLLKNAYFSIILQQNKDFSAAMMRFYK
jgi:hypothetical protein